MAIKKEDIVFSIYGFSVSCITKATDSKLNKLEEQLSESICSVEWANIDDLQYLTVSWIHTKILTEEQTEKLLSILNKLFKPTKTNHK